MHFQLRGNISKPVQVVGSKSFGNSENHAALLLTRTFLGTSFLDSTIERDDLMKNMFIRLESILFY